MINYPLTASNGNNEPSCLCQNTFVQSRPLKSRIAHLRDEAVKIDKSLLVESMVSKSINVSAVALQSPLSFKTSKRSDLPSHLKRQGCEIQEDCLRGNGADKSSYGYLGSIGSFKAFKTQNVTFASVKLTFEPNNQNSVELE
ncbi:hypothetical protein K502DRAFT_364916 [Neoconidiobolus thromboides FSU 785]|nr:hypothetical protein K502DRAFT_364916 [Neoconidiobolus thromboides FSU 785]